MNIYPCVYYDDGSVPDFLNIPEGSMVRFSRTFIEIIQKDSPRKTFGFSVAMQGVRCYDLDEAVISLGGNNQSSMDCMLRIAHYDALKGRFYNPRWLLVEFKLNSQKSQQDKADLLKKVSQTETGLKNECIDPSRNFIYNDDVYPGKKKLFESWKRGSNGQLYKNWNCFSPTTFEGYLLFKENLPYKPINSEAEILAPFLTCETSEKFDSQLNYWRQRAEEYKIKGNVEEYKWILRSLKEIFNDWIQDVPDPSEKEYMIEEWSFLDKFE